MSISKPAYPIYHYRFWPAFWVHMRPYLLFISGVAGWSGLVLSPDLQLSSWRTWLSFAAFFLAYGFGQALTDCFQTDTDRISAPYRPLSQGIVEPRAVGIVAAGGLILVSLVLMFFSSWNLLLCGLSIFGLLTYTKIKRNYWWGGPLYNAWIVALLPAMGYLITSRGELSALSQPPVMRLLLLSFFAYANFVLIGYLKDITADRETGYRTFPVVFGWKTTVATGYVFVFSSSYLVWELVGSDPVGRGLAVVGTLVALSGQLHGQFSGDQTEKNAAFPIAATVRSFILWHLAVGVAQHRSLLLFALAYYIIFETALWARPMREQI